MDPLKICDMCGTTSNETVIFNTMYAKGELNICLSCLTEGILEVTKEIKKPKKNPEMLLQEFTLEEFDIKLPTEVYGFNCEKCGEILFTDIFPIICNCGHTNQSTIIDKQNLLKRKKNK